MPNATIIGSGPNGLPPATVLARAGIVVNVLERSVQIGGACSSGETTQPKFRQDLGSSAYPMGVASPFFRSLPSRLPWIERTAPCAHRLDDGTAVMLEHSIENTVDNLDQCDRRRYRSLLEGFVSKFNELCEKILGPLWHIPRYPLLLARFGSGALKSAERKCPAYHAQLSHFGLHKSNQTLTSPNYNSARSASTSQMPPTSRTQKIRCSQVQMRQTRACMAYRPTMLGP